VFVLWVARHYFKQPLSYIGFGGTGKQVRDFIHIDDVYQSIKTQVEGFDGYKDEVWNIGGGITNSVSLLELTKICQKITGNTVPIDSVKEDRPADVKSFVTDSTRFLDRSKLQWQKDAEATVRDIYDWIRQNESALKPILT
jgi:CDP-paratose 2-epimerase